MQILGTKVYVHRYTLNFSKGTTTVIGVFFKYSRKSHIQYAACNEYGNIVIYIRAQVNLHIYRKVRIFCE
jgi:hypothetical protein